MKEGHRSGFVGDLKQRTRREFRKHAGLPKEPSASEDLEKQERAPWSSPPHPPPNRLRSILAQKVALWQNRNILKIRYKSKSKSKAELTRQNYIVGGPHAMPGSNGGGVMAYTRDSISTVTEESLRILHPYRQVEFKKKKTQ